MKLFLIISLIFVSNQYSVDSIKNDINLIENSNQLSLKLLNVLPKNENNFYSPFGITYSLYALLNGANGRTETELKNLLNIGSNETLQSINSDIKQSLELIRNKNIDQTIARFANRFLISKNFKLKEDFEKTIKNEFNSSVESVDFEWDSEEITEEVNDWIKNQTNGKIEKLFNKLPTDSAFVLSNALYLSAAWDQPFFNTSTINDIFYGFKGEKSVEMMRISRKYKFTKIPKLNASLIELPFVKATNLSMIILLPNEKNGLNQMIDGLDSETLNNGLNELLNDNKRQIELHFPKFELKTDYELINPLRDLGLISLFNENADLSRVTGSNNIQVSQVIHKGVFKVKETGIEASAATGIVSVVKIGHIGKPIQVTVNKPFLFLIQDNQSGLVLFMGQVSDI